MERLTRRINGVVVYVGAKNPYSTGQIPCEVEPAGVREMMDRLAAYGAAAKLCDMETLCEDVYRAKDAELTLDALQELVDKGLGGRFLDLRRALKGVTL